MTKQPQRKKACAELNQEKRYRTRRRLTIRGVLSFFIVLTFVRAAFMHRYENMFVCVLSLALFCVPMLIERSLDIDIPPLMEAIIYCFIFAAEILGEINSFYTIIPGWDTMLHTINGFLVAAVGFSLVDLFNRSERFSFKLSPLFLAIVAFCFSMTVGVLWEFFEFGADQMLGTDMQKDFIVRNINSVSLNPDGLNTVVHVPIESLVVNGEDWMQFPGGYLDIGLIDTMKDLQVNFIGAVAFSIIGYFYVKTRGKGKLAASLIPIVLDPQNNEPEEKGLKKKAPDREPNADQSRPINQNDEKE
ncbi:hypothetical protein [Candidatus Agathobaculum pullicola]|uniref:hypothetical protein n=1 Tax=Candidatus Agathobaculum pullicola TaxID=2838426 RepID=UPI003F914F55